MEINKNQKYDVLEGGDIKRARVLKIFKTAPNMIFIKYKIIGQTDTSIIEKERFEAQIINEYLTTTG